MSVKVSWDNESKTTIRYDFEGEWTWDEFRAAAQVAFALTRSVTYTVDTISNFPPGTRLPANAFLQFRRAMADAPKNRGVTVIAGGSSFIKTMVSVFSKVNKQLGERLMVVDSLQEARKVLTERRKPQTAAAGS
jgi:hypothetical protein